VTFRNNGDDFWSDVHIFASKTENKGKSEYYPRVAVRAGETAKYSFFFTPDTTGIYNLWFCIKNDGSGELGRGTIEIITEAEAAAFKANLSISHSVINGEDKIAYGNHLYGKASVKNNGTNDFHGSIELQLWHQGKNSNSAVSGPSKSFDLDIPVGKTVSFEYEFDNLSSNYYYRIKAVYKEQSGTLSGGGLWDVKIDMQDGIMTWKSDGTVAGQAYSSTLRPGTTVCGLFADCSSKISRVSPIRNNPNVIYAFAAGMAAPKGLDENNAVYGKYADHINLVKEQPYYLPISFSADRASFTYTFEENEAGTSWHAFTMPFAVDSIYLDDFIMQLGDTLNHFWIYEFAAEGNNGEVIFAPATYLRGETPYIIAADAKMAGRSLVFVSHNANFHKTGSNKMVVSSPHYLFYGSTLVPKVKDCYVLNEDGTAFEYTTTNKTLSAMEPYFTTKLSEDLRLQSIVLPEIPVNNNEDPTGIKVIKSYMSECIYNIAGQRISRPVKGVNIINGKKILK
jgi:hypothetical protein